MRFPLPACLAALVLMTTSFLPAQQTTTWKNEAGRAITASFERLSGPTVHLRLASGRPSQIPLASLDWPSARKAIALHWSPKSVADVRLSIPDRVTVAETSARLRPVPSADQPPAPWSRHRSEAFEFDCEKPPDPRALLETARVFEATRELLHRLPWRIDAQPLRGSHFRARIFSDLASYEAAGAPRGTLGLFRSDTGEIYLSSEGATGSADTLQHEITHQMMQRLLPVIPWWIAEGTAELVAMMRYQNGTYDCRRISRREVVPQLRARAPFCSDAAFLAALEHRSESTAEIEFQRIASLGAAATAELTAETDALRALLEPLQQKADALAALFALPHGQSAPAPDLTPDLPARRAAPAKHFTNPYREFTQRTLQPGSLGSPDLVPLYATSALMVWHLNTTTPDKGEGLARYFWAVQQLRAEIDEALRRQQSDHQKFVTELKAASLAVTKAKLSTSRLVSRYENYFRAACQYANQCGGISLQPYAHPVFQHLPNPRIPIPKPPNPAESGLPTIPQPPAPLLPAAEITKRRTDLLHTLLGTSKPLDFVATVKDSLLSLGISPGQR